MSNYVHNIPLFSFENVRRLMFWELVLLFFNLFRLEKEIWFERFTKIIYGISAVFLSGVFAHYTLSSSHYLYFTFGNIAHSAEFIGLCIAFQLGALTRLRGSPKSSLVLTILLSILFVFSLTYVFLSGSRAVSIGVILLILTALYLNKNYIKTNAKMLIFILVCSMFTYSLIHLFANIGAGQFFLNKSYSIRWLLYTDTLKMIFENPLGIGLGQYELGSIPYLKNIPEFNEIMIYNTPHNDFLHILSEEGIILFFLYLFLGLSLVYFLWNDIKRIFFSHPEFTYFSLMLFILSLFQFPLMNPVPFFMTALMVSYFFTLREEKVLTYQINYGTRLTLIGINLITVFIILTTFSTQYISYNFPSNQFINKVGCLFGNRNWLSCLNVANSYIDRGDYDKAEPYILRTLAWQASNYQGIKLLGFNSLYKGDKRKACALFNKYRSFFRDPTSLHPIIESECRIPLLP